MKFLCLIHLNENELAALPAREASDLNLAHWNYNDTLRANGNYLVAEALEPGRTTQRVQVRQGKVSILDGPFTEAKEMIAGFYFIEAKDMQEATAIASRIPSAAIGTIEVRQARMLHVDGMEDRWGSDFPNAKDEATVTPR